MYSFEWDPKKAASNLKDHRVSFSEATTVFGDMLAMNMPDPDHSEGEERFLVLGMPRASRLVVVSYAPSGRHGPGSSAPDWLRAMRDGI